MTPSGVRRTDFLIALAYATDLACGQSQDFALRSCVLATRIGKAAGLESAHGRDIFEQALLRYIGCNADSHLLSAFFGDEIALRRDLARIDLGNQAEIADVIVRAMQRGAAGASAEIVARAIQRGMEEGLATSVPILAGHCEVAKRIGARLGLDPTMCENLSQLYERWDGHGLPRGLKGEAVAPAVRVVTLAQDALVLEEAYGLDAMRGMIAKRSGGAYEPALVDVFLARADIFMRDAAGPVGHATILELEPEPRAVLDEAGCDEAYLALADMADMRMPFTLGHSRRVADLCEAAGRAMALPAADIRALRRAGLAHDLGELAVPVATWMRPGPLTARETDIARLHAYHGERILARFDGAAPSVGALVSRHHERVDGSGYHRGVRAPDLSPAARILAAAEAFQTAREPRPHRAALSDAAAAAGLRARAREGRHDAEIVEAVLAAAGQAARRSPAGGERVASLTPREIEVLQQIAAGKTAKEAALALDIALKTADNHIQNLYSKIGVATRAGAVLYALERGLARPASARP
jgi:HD-GYP domain-containing protein (c-di-GMP phosphodiesterase class II)